MLLEFWSDLYSISGATLFSHKGQEKQETPRDSLWKAWLIPRFD